MPLSISAIRKEAFAGLKLFGFRKKDVKVVPNYLNKRSAVGCYGYYLFFNEEGRWAVEELVTIPATREDPADADYRDVWTGEPYYSPSMAIGVFVGYVVKKKLENYLVDQGEAEQAAAQRNG